MTSTCRECVRSNALCDRGQPVGASGRQDQVKAFGREDLGERFADARRGACDEGGSRQSTVNLRMTTGEPAVSNHVTPSATRSNLNMYSPAVSGAGHENDSATDAPGLTSPGISTRW